MSDLHSVSLSSEKFTQEQLDEIEQQYDQDGTHCWQDENGLHFVLDSDELETLRERANAARSS